jgi:GH24 family phage-related lysozyme (muramidase)
MASSHTLHAIIKEEGNIPYMYRDTKGNITIGVGYLLKTVNDAIKLAFYHKNTWQKATLEEIIAEFNTISNLPFGNYTAKWYKQHAKLIIPPSEIDKLLIVMAEAKEKELALKLPYWEYPESVRHVLLDMAYNLGTEGLFRKFPKFVQAIKKRDWIEASKECRSRSVGETRNLMRINFLQSVSKEKNIKEPNESK